MSEDYTTMPDDQLAETVQAGTAELERRRTVRDAETRTDSMCLDYLQAVGRENGGPWEPPTGFLGAYPRGWRVTHDDHTYEATAPGTTSPPPSDDWTEVDPDTPLVPFWEPGTYDQDDHVRDAGKVWRALADGADGPRPSEFPGGWSLVE